MTPRRRAPRRKRSTGRLAWGIRGSLLVPVALVIVLFVGLTNWVQVPFSWQVSTPRNPCTGCVYTAGDGQNYGTTFPAGQTISVTWDDVTGGVVNVTVVAPNWSVLIAAVGTQGSFTVPGGIYLLFETSPAVNESAQAVVFSGHTYRSLL